LIVATETKCLHTITDIHNIITQNPKSIQTLTISLHSSFFVSIDVDL